MEHRGVVGRECRASLRAEAGLVSKASFVESRHSLQVLSGMLGADRIVPLDLDIAACADELVPGTGDQGTCVERVILPKPQTLVAPQPMLTQELTADDRLQETHLAPRAARL